MEEKEIKDKEEKKKSWRFNIKNNDDITKDGGPNRFEKTEQKNC